MNYFVISLVKSLISRNLCGKSVKVNFRNFHMHVAETFSNFYVVKCDDVKSQLMTNFPLFPLGNHLPDVTASAGFKAAPELKNESVMSILGSRK